MLISIVFLYVICWAPLLMFNVLHSFANTIPQKSWWHIPEQLHNEHKHLKTAFSLMAYFNRYLSQHSYSKELLSINILIDTIGNRIKIILHSFLVAWTHWFMDLCLRTFGKVSCLTSVVAANATFHWVLNNSRPHQQGLLASVIAEGTEIYPWLHSLPRTPPLIVLKIRMCLQQIRT